MTERKVLPELSSLQSVITCGVHKRVQVPRRSLSGDHSFRFPIFCVVEDGVFLSKQDCHSLGVHARVYFTAFTQVKV